MVSQFFSYILQGTSVTIAVTLVALPLGLLIGLLLALFYNYGGFWVSRLAAVYSLVMRGVPPIALLFILYFLLSGRLINLSPFWLVRSLLASSARLTRWKSCAVRCKLSEKDK